MCRAGRRSGAGKSTLMRMIHGNYLAAGGSIRVGDVDVATAEPRRIVRLRRETLGYVSQFLRVVPRVPTLDVVAEPLRVLGVPADAARDRAAGLLARLQYPRAAVVAVAHHLFGGRAAAGQHRARLCPTPIRRCCWTSRRRAHGCRQPRGRAGVDRRGQGAWRGDLGIFHDEGARARVCDRLVDVTGFAPRSAA